MRLAVFFVPEVTGIAWSQAVQKNESEKSLPLPKSTILLGSSKIAPFSSINWDVLSQMSLNSVYLFFLFIDAVSSRGCIVLNVSIVSE
jgi:hypothetical protein